MTDKRALVFDDEEIIRVLFARIFSSKKIQVDAYENPCLYFCIQSGADTCPVPTRCTDFLLTDQRMPDMTGLEFLRRIKEMQCKIPDSRKALISAILIEEELKEAGQLNVCVFHKSEAKEQISLWVEKHY